MASISPSRDFTQDSSSDDAPPAKRAKAATLQLRTHPNQLRDLWRGDVTREGQTLPVVAFYSHRGSSPHRCFSNFHQGAFDFTLPASCDGAAPRTVRVGCGEQAIMLSKAALFRDATRFDVIAAPGKRPEEYKALGRRVERFDGGAWDGAVVDVAIAVVSQKFASDPALWKVLDATGDRVLAEMTKNDSFWGTGIDRSHADAQTPSAWPGTNILGYALMVARERLRARETGAAAAPASSAPASAAPDDDDDEEEEDDDDDAPPPTPSRKRKAPDASTGGSPTGSGGHASIAVVDGDVLTATEQWLLHQTNATKDATLASEADIDWSRTARSKMMASQVFDKYKYALALIYKGPRPRAPLQRVGKAELHGGSGDRRGVANLFAQLAPRKGSHPKNPFGAEDGPAQRLARFESALADFARQASALRGGLACVAMPANIGCGKAGGDPGAYRAAVERFAAAHPACRVVLYRFEPKRGRK